MPKSIEASLDYREMLSTANIGAIRRISGIRSANKPNRAVETSQWTRDCEAAAAEYVVARHLGICWNLGCGSSLYAGDVGECEVKHTLLDRGCLIVRPEHAAERIYILVTGEMPVYQIRGWYWGYDAKTDKYWNEMIQEPAYMVGQEYLNDMSEIVKELVGEV